MRWAQTVRLNLSNDRQKVDSSDLNWGDSDRAKIVYSDKLTGEQETIAIDKINDSVKATMSIIENSGIEDTRADGDKSTEYIGNYIYYLLNAFYTGSELTIGINDADGEDYSETTKNILIPSLKNVYLPTTDDRTNEMLQVHFAKNKLYFFGENAVDDEVLNQTINKKTGIIIYKENKSTGTSANSNTFAHTSLQYNEIKMLAEGDNTDQKLELSLDMSDGENPIPTIELENKDNSSKPQKCMIQPDNIKVSVEDDNGDLQEDLSINNNSVDITSYSEENVPNSMSELKSNSLFFKDNMDIPENYENPETDASRDVLADRKIGDSQFYGLKISKDGIDINPNPNIEQWHEGWSSNKTQKGQGDEDWNVPEIFKLYPVGLSEGHLSTGIVDASSAPSQTPETLNNISFLSQGNFNYYDFNLSKYCNDYLGHRNIYDTGPEYKMHVRIEVVKGIRSSGGILPKKYISFCMNINLGRWYNYTINNKKGDLDDSGNLEVYDTRMSENGNKIMGGNTETIEDSVSSTNKSIFIPSSLEKYGWSSSGAPPIINFSTNQKGLLQIPGPHITPQLSSEQGGSYFSSADGNVTTNLSTGPDYVVAHNLHGNYVYYQRWPCKVQTDINLHSSAERYASAARKLTGPSFNNSPGSGLTEDDYECDYWIRIIWNEYEVDGANDPDDIDEIKLIPPTGMDPESASKNIQIRVTQIA